MNKISNKFVSSAMRDNRPDSTVCFSCRIHWKHFQSVALEKVNERKLLACESNKAIAGKEPFPSRTVSKISLMAANASFSVDLKYHSSIDLEETGKDASLGFWSSMFSGRKSSFSNRKKVSLKPDSCWERSWRISYSLFSSTSTVLSKGYEMHSCLAHSL